eukprot:EG_transcript_20330
MDEGDGAAERGPRLNPELAGMEALMAATAAGRTLSPAGSPSWSGIACEAGAEGSQASNGAPLPPPPPAQMGRDPSPPGLRVAVAGMTLLCVFVLWQLANILYPLPAGHAHQEALASRIQALKADPDPDPFLLPMLRLKAIRLGNWQDSRVRVRAVGLSAVFFGCLWGVAVAAADRCPTPLTSALLLATAAVLGSWASTSTFAVSPPLPHVLEGW